MQIVHSFVLLPPRNSPVLPVSRKVEPAEVGRPHSIFTGIYPRDRLLALYEHMPFQAIETTLILAQRHKIKRKPL